MAQQSKFDRLWTEEMIQAAQAEGWELAITVDSGRPISAAYFEVFPVTAAFSSRDMAAKFVIQKAYTGSKLHIAALTAIRGSRNA